MSFDAQKIVHWTVDYLDDRMPRDITVPHAWKQDLSVTEEGPVIYRTEILVPKQPSSLRFEGVSYRAEVTVAGQHVLTHDGIWDAFEVPLTQFRGDKVLVEVKVTKNGGPTFPVRSVASGFLPYVYHTFGGIYRDVWLTEPEETPHAPRPRVRVTGKNIFVDDQPFYMRGLLHWGWYPEIGHTNPSDEIIRKEVVAARGLGFNTVKFCLWVPSHRYLEILAEEEMLAWIELPLWNPDSTRLDAISDEIETIVRQYRRHSNVICWTLGCELGAATSFEFRAQMTGLIRNLTWGQLVKDDSGGAEMYGGDLREAGTFNDFHPYCDTEFYPSVLDSLENGPRTVKPILLGEFNDVDVHRDLGRTEDRLPFWASALSELNAPGVRWQMDLPRILRICRFALEPRGNRHAALMESSRKKALFMRKYVVEAVRARDIQGYVITGWRDTPISSSGFFDDWGAARFKWDEVRTWNAPNVIFLIPHRKPRWTNGGNRPGFVDPLNHLEGDILIKVGAAVDRKIESSLVWTIVDSNGKRVRRGHGNMLECDPHDSREVGEVFWPDAKPGEYRLLVEFGDGQNEWPLWVVPKFPLIGWTLNDPFGDFQPVQVDASDNPSPYVLSSDLSQYNSEFRGLICLCHQATKPAPFWRESAYEFRDDSFWKAVPFAEQWSRLLPISGDRTIDLGAIGQLVPKDTEIEVVMNRIDVRTYDEAPVLVRAGEAYFTTLRPFGGLGTQPACFADNPAGQLFVAAIRATYT